MRLPPVSRSTTTPVDSAELLVLAGEVVMGHQSYERGSWIRLPAGDYPEIAAGEQGATLYLKTGHLADLAAQA
jgi:hypothetical protein